MKFDTGTLTVKVVVFNAYTGVELWYKFFCGKDAEQRAEKYADNHWNDNIRSYYEASLVCHL
jgi:hypothetical protein